MKGLPPGAVYMSVQPTSFSFLVWAPWSLPTTSMVPSTIASHMAGLSASGTQNPRANGPSRSMLRQSFVTNIANGLASAVTGRPAALACRTIRIPSRVDR